MINNIFFSKITAHPKNMETPYKKMATASCLLILITIWMFYKSDDTNFNSSYIYIAFNETKSNRSSGK